MTYPAFDLLDAAYSLATGARALQALRIELNARSDGEPLSALDRDHLLFVLEAMEQKAATVADCVIDEIEAKNRAKGQAA